jgi:hypothetical protein
MKRSFVLILSLATLFLGQVFASGPFGFEPGMTRDQVIQLVGKQAIKESKGDVLVLTTAPKPHSAFESYLVVISPEKGVVKVVAIGNTVQTNGYGQELKDAYTAVVDGATQKYGTPTNSFDFLPSGSMWQEPQYWLMGLLKKDRELQTFWQFKDPVNHITVISVEASAMNSEAGYITCGYEFQGFHDYLTAKKARQNDNF